MTLLRNFKDPLLGITLQLYLLNRLTFYKCRQSLHSKCKSAGTLVVIFLVTSLRCEINFWMVRYNCVLLYPDKITYMCDVGKIFKIAGYFLKCLSCLFILALSITGFPLTELL